MSATERHKHSTDLGPTSLRHREKSGGLGAKKCKDGRGRYYFGVRTYCQSNCPNKTLFDLSAAKHLPQAILSSWRILCLAIAEMSGWSGAWDEAVLLCSGGCGETAFY